MLYCAADIISYQLQDGVFHCTLEMLHSQAVLRRLTDGKRTLYLTRIPELHGELHGACNFKDPKLALGMGKDLKIAGSFEEIKNAMPGFVAEYKVRRILFDDPDLFAQFEEPGLKRMMQLVPCVPDSEELVLSAGPRFEPTPAPAPATPEFQSLSDSFASTSENESRGCIFWAIAVTVLIWLLSRACS